MKSVYHLADLRAGLPGDESIRLGVLGDPVAHSRSPEMQNAALVQVGSEWRYARFQIAPNELAEAVQLMGTLGFLGVNLTVPHKFSGLALVDDADEFASAVGAINTIVFRDDQRFGANTDGPGFERAIAESFGIALPDQRVLLLGAGGGAGRAVAAQCAHAGCRALTLVNRDPAKAVALARSLQGNEIVAIPWSGDSLGAALARSDLVVQATALGLRSGDPSPLPGGLLEPRHLVYDLVTQPTALLAEARTAGAAAASGLTLLLHQGALAFELWLEQAAPLAQMRAALESLDFPDFLVHSPRSFSTND